MDAKNARRAAAQPGRSPAEEPWEVEEELDRFRPPGERLAEVHPPSPSPTAPSPTALPPDLRTLSARRALDRALDRWWQSALLPDSQLLREGSLVLQAGHELEESQRTLLLRAALAHRRGMLTALRFQTDPERTAVVLAEAVCDGSLPLEGIQPLLQGDENSPEWRPALVERLRQCEPGQRLRAEPALALLAQPTAARGATRGSVRGAPARAAASAQPSSQKGLWFGLLGVVLVAVGVVVFWGGQRQRPVATVAVPAGSYSVHVAPDAGPKTVELKAFVIDRYEATVGQYRVCYERGACPWPATPASATRTRYLLDLAFAEFPMVHVDHKAAERFCRFQGKRLPTAAEWEVAAAYAPASQRMYRFPWGDEWVAQRANAAPANVGDTVQVGSYQPAGDSPLGVSEMAGNVAEWTSTPLLVEGVTHYLVRGGSFVSEPGELRTAAVESLAAQTVASWLGVRCASTPAE
ncbi:MAG: formylglycine-generating enzyme family protein [Caldilinea sp.]